jgi:hypothetical protein
MMSLSAWREAMRERSRKRMVSHLKPPQHDVFEQRLLCLETFRQWGVIDEDEYRKRKQSLTVPVAPVSRSSERRTESLRRSRRRPTGLWSYLMR